MDVSEIRRYPKDQAGRTVAIPIGVHLGIFKAEEEAIERVNGRGSDIDDMFRLSGRVPTVPAWMEFGCVGAIASGVAESGGIEMSEIASARTEEGHNAIGHPDGSSPVKTEILLGSTLSGDGRVSDDEFLSPVPAA